MMIQKQIMKANLNEYGITDFVAPFEKEKMKNRNYWKYLKAKLKKEQNEVVSATTQLKLKAPDGKMRLTDCMDMEF